MTPSDKAEAERRYPPPKSKASWNAFLVQAERAAYIAGREDARDEAAWDNAVAKGRASTERERVIEECAEVADVVAKEKRMYHEWGFDIAVPTALEVAERIRALASEAGPVEEER